MLVSSRRPQRSAGDSRPYQLCAPSMVGAALRDARRRPHTPEISRNGLVCCGGHFALRASTKPAPAVRLGRRSDEPAQRLEGLMLQFHSAADRSVKSETFAVRRLVASTCGLRQSQVTNTRLRVSRKAFAARRPRTQQEPLPRLATGMRSGFRCFREASGAGVLVCREGGFRAAGI